MPHGAEPSPGPKAAIAAGPEGERRSGVGRREVKRSERAHARPGAARKGGRRFWERERDEDSGVYAAV